MKQIKVTNHLDLSKTKNLKTTNKRWDDSPHNWSAAHFEDVYNYLIEPFLLFLEHIFIDINVFIQSSFMLVFVSIPYTQTMLAAAASNVLMK